jgi:hypothetical protein
MRAIGVVGCALALGLLIGAGAAVQAEETGVAEIHSWVKAGHKTCLADHFHSGNGSGNTRQQAEKQAIQSWADFTAWEYGSSWGRYTLAASKKMSCERGDSWSCFVEARPCKSR